MHDGNPGLCFYKLVDLGNEKAVTDTICENALKEPNVQLGSSIHAAHTMQGLSRLRGLEDGCYPCMRSHLCYLPTQFYITILYLASWWPHTGCGRCDSLPPPPTTTPALQIEYIFVCCLPLIYPIICFRNVQNLVYWSGDVRVKCLNKLGAPVFYS